MLITGYVILLLWGFKTPVHFRRPPALRRVRRRFRYLLLGLFLLLFCTAFFSAYLAGLLLLTAGSLLIFVPMRIGTEFT